MAEVSMVRPFVLAHVKTIVRVRASGLDGIRVGAPASSPWCPVPLVRSYACGDVGCGPVESAGALLR